MNQQKAMFNGTELKQLWNAAYPQSNEDNLLYLVLKTSPEHLTEKLKRAFPPCGEKKRANGHQPSLQTVSKRLEYKIRYSTIGRQRPIKDTLDELREKKDFSLILYTLSDDQLNEILTLLKEHTR